MIKKAFILATLFVLGLASVAGSNSSIDSAAIDASFGRPGQAMDGGVYRMRLPRTDLSVNVGSIHVSPGLALGGYAAFVPAPQGALVVGDLVLLEPEIQAVMSALKHSRFEITALHNHLRGESPHVMYMHFMGLGAAGQLSGQLRDALALSKTPLGPLGSPLQQPLLFQSALEEQLGRKDRVSGNVLSFSVARAESITMRGVTIPPAAGVATVINVQDAGGGNLVTAGDFVLTAGEVDLVQDSLLSHGFEVTALHHHMVGDSPPLYYMHFWAVAPSTTLAAGINDALSHINIAR